MRQVGYLLGGGITLWVVLAIPARRLWGDTAAVYGAVALLLCLVPTCLTLWWAARARNGSPEQQMLAVLGGAGVRMFLVLAGALALVQFVPYFQEQAGFLVWLLIFYLFTLGLEVALLLADQKPAASRRANGGQALPQGQKGTEHGT